MQSNTFVRFTLVATVAAALVACGGGSSDIAASGNSSTTETLSFAPNYVADSWVPDPASVVKNIPVSATQLLCDSGIDTTCLAPVTPSAASAVATMKAIVPADCKRYTPGTVFSSGEKTYYNGKTYLVRTFITQTTVQTGNTTTTNTQTQKVAFSGLVPDDEFNGSKYWEVEAKNSCNGLGEVGIATSALVETPYSPAVGDQGQAGTCAAWAASTAISTVANKAVGRTDKVQRANVANIASPRHLYTQLPDPTDPVSLAMKKLCNSSALSEVISTAVTTGGVGSLLTAPYAPIGTGLRNDDAKVNQCEYAVATKNNARWSIDKAKFKINGMRLVPVDVESIKSEIRAGNAVAFGAKLNQAFHDAAAANKILKRADFQTAQASSSVHAGGHAMTIVGFDDNIKAFKVQNSWGKGFGENGFIYIDYALMVDTSIFMLESNVYVPYIAPSSAQVAAATTALKNSVKSMLAGGNLYIDPKNANKVTDSPVANASAYFDLNFSGQDMQMSAPVAASSADSQSQEAVTYSELELLAAAYKFLKK
jgi:hypothetical protein